MGKRCISTTVCNVCFGLDSLTSSICHWVSVIQSKGFFPKLIAVAAPASHEGSAASPFTAVCMYSYYLASLIHPLPALSLLPSNPACLKAHVSDFPSSFS